MSFNRRKNDVKKLLIDVENFMKFTEELSDNIQLMSFYVKTIYKKEPVHFLNEMILLSEFYGNANKLLQSSSSFDKRALSFEINHIERLLTRLNFSEVNTVKDVEELWTNQ